MIPNPFAKRPLTKDASINNRRSTRIDFVCPVVVSGRDAAGEVFREETETSTVNLHGCKIRLNHQVLVGMVVTIETLHTQAPAKAICVHVWESPRGLSSGEIAVQLLRPQNLWGVQDPPADWQAASGTLTEGRAARRDGDSPAAASRQTASPSAMPAKSAPAANDRTRPAAPAAPVAVKAPAAPARPAENPTASHNTPAAPPGISTRAAPRATPQPAAPRPTLVRPSQSAPAGPSGGESRLAEIEERSWQLMDSVLQVLRDQADELVRGTITEFRQHIETLVTDAEERLKQRADESYGDIESSISILRDALSDQLTQRTEEIVESAKEALHARVREMLTAMLRSPAAKPTQPPPKK